MFAFPIIFWGITKSGISAIEATIASAVIGAAFCEYHIYKNKKIKSRSEKQLTLLNKRVAHFTKTNTISFEHHRQDMYEITRLETSMADTASYIRAFKGIGLGLVIITAIATFLQFFLSRIIL